MGYNSLPRQVPFCGDFAVPPAGPWRRWSTLVSTFHKTSFTDSFVTSPSHGHPGRDPGAHCEPARLVQRRRHAARRRRIRLAACSPTPRRR